MVFDSDSDTRPNLLESVLLEEVVELTFAVQKFEEGGERDEEQWIEEEKDEFMVVVVDLVSVIEEEGTGWSVSPDRDSPSLLVVDVSWLFRASRFVEVNWLGVPRLWVPNGKEESDSLMGELDREEVGLEEVLFRNKSLTLERDTRLMIPAFREEVEEEEVGEGEEEEEGKGGWKEEWIGKDIEEEGEREGESELARDSDPIVEDVKGRPKSKEKVPFWMEEREECLKWFLVQLEREDFEREGRSPWIEVFCNFFNESAFPFPRERLEREEGKEGEEGEEEGEGGGEEEWE